MEKDKRKLQIIKLKGGAEVMVDWTTKSQCKACGQKIYWAETKNGKQMPINACGLCEWESHFATCPEANKFRNMKKIIVTVLILLVGAASAYAASNDQALIDLWNRRTDLQKAFPGSPYGNTRLEKWAIQYGWQEAPELFNFYPEKQIVEKIIESKTGDHIRALENQINDLNKRLADLDWKLTQTKVQTAGQWQRYCISTELDAKINIPKRMNDGEFCGNNVGKSWDTIYLMQK